MQRNSHLHCNCRQNSHGARQDLLIRFYTSQNCNKIRETLSKEIRIFQQQKSKHSRLVPRTKKPPQHLFTKTHEIQKKPT